LSGKDNDFQSFGQQFRRWRIENNISAYRIAKLTGINHSFISNIEADRRPMPESLMRRIAELKEFGLSYETMRAWKLQAEYETGELQEAFKLVQPKPAKKSKKPDNMAPLDGLYRIPLKMIVSAGELKNKDELEEPVYIDWYGLSTLSTDLFCLKVSGDSMWPPIPDGAILLVRETETLKNGERYVVETEEAQMTFKLIQFDKKGAYLVPLNPAYPKVSLADAQLKRIYQVLSYKVDWS
jgi:SOS-response transcriptional repressor LexA